LMATALLAPAIEVRRPIQTSAIPPLPILRSSSYSPNRRKGE
jgi:hypothetical protein